MYVQEYSIPVITPTPSELMDLQRFKSWLETKWYFGTYNYKRPSHCAIAQYFQENGYPDARVWTDRWFPFGYDTQFYYRLPKGMDEAVQRDGFCIGTFGGALRRLKKYL